MHTLKKVQKFKQFVGQQTWYGFVFALLAGVFLFFSETLTAISIPLFLVNLDLLSAHDNLPAYLQKLPRSLFFSVSLIFFCVLCRSIALATCQYFAGHAQYSFIAHLRKKLTNMGISQRSVVSSHTILYFMNDVVLPMGASFQTFALSLSYVSSAIILVTLGLIYAPSESGVAITLLIISLIPLHFLYKKTTLQGQQTGIHSKRLMQSLTEGLKNFFLFKVYGQLGNIINKTEKNILEYDRVHKSYVLTNVAKANISLVVGSFILCATTLISNRYFNTDGVKLLTFFYLFVRVVQYCAAIILDSSGFFFQIPKIKELQHWLNGQHDIIAQSKNPSPLQCSETQSFHQILTDQGLIVQARQISFSYPDSKTLFERIDFTVSQGKPLLIKGSSGVGKSTLLMLILGHLEPTEGNIAINDINAPNAKELLYNCVGYVGAESYIIQGSVRSNLLCGHQGDITLSDDELWNILSEVQLDQDIRRLENGLDHNLLEFTQLSTGQKQRLAIARALLRKPKLLLLDEATANLDQVTEKNFINVLAPKLDSITSIIISHKSSFDEFAKRGTLLDLGQPHS